ncbi:MAG: phosphate ABC transporter substrate-binding protein [Magnetococcales bacterium]|nr:phosphate ABC transporter substrate-binding protein [Magnetococcales bacterium]
MAILTWMSGCGSAWALGEEDTALWIRGSETLKPVLEAWVKPFHERHPDIGLHIQGGGSVKGIAALINGHGHVAATSRTMQEWEAQLAVASGFAKPQGQVVGWDAVAVIVHRDNGIQALDLDQLAGIYRKHRRIARWTALDNPLPGCMAQQIHPLSRTTKAGIYGIFRARLFGAHLADMSRRLTFTRDDPGLVNRVAEDPCAIGYVSLSSLTSGVRAVCLAEQSGEACITPTPERIRDRSYPLIHPLYLYTLGQPQGDLKTFLDWTLDPEAQAILVAQGFVPAH